ncbi:hypothetical protein [Paenibacillus sp. GCM10012303]|uniref:exo-rhamnogalacturonan lyase family protein n=1 Tax=Paenibacillus sp. GCM10012303 TaxID=3317340 RepID=UPI00361D1481
MKSGARAERAVKLVWLSGKPEAAAGVTWGVPWKEGVLLRDEPFSLCSASGRKIPVQSWPTAFWPDGSVKWSAHAAAIHPEEDPGGLDGYTLVPGETDGAASPNSADTVPAASSAKISVTETASAIIVDTGALVVSLNRQGSHPIAGVVRDGIEVCRNGRLIAVKEETALTSGVRIRKELSYESRICQATIEQRGPVRAVVKMEGRLRAADSRAEWLPFVLRLSFYAGDCGVKAVHTFFYDGNPHQDFITGLGLSFEIPMRGPLYNRHVRFAGDSGFFSESPKSLHTRRTQGKYRELHERQRDGEAVEFDPQEDAYFLGLLDESAVWDSFKLVQDSSSHYRIAKRTKEACCWLKAAVGRRAGGLGYVGSEGGGMAAGVRNFWQKHPASLEVRHMAKESAEFRVWLWSPDGPAMDLRHYDTETHVESAYEGAEEMRATPYGIANTSEMTFWFPACTPNAEQLSALLQESREPSLLVCEPAYYHETRSFGYWSLPDRSSPLKAYLEERLDGIIGFYKEETEHRDWYGFWDYGDFMHSYDPVRHVWNYDLGGCAWQNTELAANMWLWVMFLRSGRADIFRMAEAMTRHTSEVDVYHFGEYAGLGSRHNVVHWGCGCKEARIAMAGLHRYYYYLTADERLGDMLDEVKDADYSTVNLDPMRAYFPRDGHPTHIRVGPDWAAFCSNWMTRWERYEDTAYRDKLLAGLNGIKQANFRLLSGPTYGYDPKTGVLTPMGDDNWGRHLAICMGGPQVWFELAMMLKDPEWEEMLAEFGVFYNSSKEEKEAATGGAISHKSFGHPVLGTGIGAFGAYYTNNEASARTTWSILLANPYARVNLQQTACERTHVRTAKEVEWINTNEAAQWSLNTIISLELISEALPGRLPEERG